MSITTPMITLFVTVTRVTGNKEASVERSIADQQLVEVRVDCTNTIPQSRGIRSFSIVNSGRYGLVESSLEVGLASSLVINKNNFCKLKQRNN